MESRHLIIGAGEIGKSVYEVLKNSVDVQIRDKESDIVGQFNYIHIAFPFGDDFVDRVREYEELYNPHTIVIHSTVKVGTIRELGEKAVHVPIRGKHPNLAESIRTFRLYVGGNDIRRIKQVAEIFKQEVPDVYILDRPPETTEILKLMSTSYYGWNILFEKEMYRICKEYGVPYEIVYKDSNESYNKGYRKMGDEQFVRPVLTHMDGPIGGHCIYENSLLFPESYINITIQKKQDEFRNQ